MKNLLSIPLVIIAAVFIIVFSSFKILNANSTFSTNETEDLLYMLEEEKLAYDVYNEMDTKWNLLQFSRIKQSETMHINVLKNILDKNNVKYSLLEPGKFNDLKLQKLYNELIAQGNTSATGALKVGAMIEEVDIYDLRNFAKKTNNTDILNAYKFLECGSGNHLRAFTKGLNAGNTTYSPKFISQKDYDSILNAAQEPCGQQFGMQGMGMQNGKGMRNGSGRMQGKGRMQGNCMGKGGKQFQCLMSNTK